MADSGRSHAPGPATIGPYTILGELGRGGMGTVYRARDERLRRDVALKVVPQDLRLSPARLARFEQEARIVAALNHPNIAAIYGIEEGTGGIQALVLELVEGKSLAARIAEGRLRISEALDIAKQIAQALEAAHEKGIVHRDLKPANVVLTAAGLVKVLDFGIAKMTDTSDLATDQTTVTAGLTHEGVVVGTPAYMSPEQARAQTVDRRTDIWAFGCVLYEMLAGRRVFEGGSATDTLAAVLTAEPNWNALPSQLSPAIQVLLKRCLERERSKRLADVAAVRFVLEDMAASAPPGAIVNRSRTWALAAVVVLFAALASTGWVFLRVPDRAATPTRLDVDLGPEAAYGEFSTVAVSPDGTRIVFPVMSSGKQMLGTRLLYEVKVTVLPRTENGRDPFFSPDGEWIGFFGDGKLRKIPAQGGAVVDITEAIDGRGASWGADGTIVASLNGSGGLSRVAQNGAFSRGITAVADEQTHRWPQVLHGSGDVIFSSGSTGMVKKRVMILSARDSIVRPLVEDAFFGRVLPSGELVYIQGGALWGVPFNRERGTLAGAARKLLEDVVNEPIALAGQFDFSANGLFVYRSGAPRTGEYAVKWLTKDGSTPDLVSRPDEYLFPQFSPPDGAKLLLNGGEGPYIFDAERGSLLSRVRNAAAAMWMPDGKHLIVRRVTGSSAFQAVFARDDGTGDQLVLDERKGMTLSSVSSDGRRWFYSVRNEDASYDVWSQTLDLTDPERPKPGRAQPLWSSLATEGGAVLSPNLHWLAYTSNESGRSAIYVRSFPDLGPPIRVSGDQGPISSVIHWSKKRNELYFHNRDGYILIVEYSVKDGRFISKTPRVWSPTPIRTVGGGAFDLHPNGERFVVFPRDDNSSERGVRMTFLLNGLLR